MATQASTAELVAALQRVDGKAEIVAAYRATAPDAPAVYGRGDRAEALPALPGWSFPVGDIFE